MKAELKSVPSHIESAKVICYTPIDRRHNFTGNCKQIVAGTLMGPIAGLAICQYDKDAAFYLFGCDANWNSQTDTWHQTLEEAKDQAEYEYEGTSRTWTQVK